MSLTLQQATTIVERALRTGRETNCAPLAVAVLDAGGHLKAFAREDGAGIVRPQIAVGKVGAVGISGDVSDRMRRARWPASRRRRSWPIRARDRLRPVGANRFTVNLFGVERRRPCLSTSISATGARRKSP